MSYTDKDFRAAENIYRNAKVAVLSIDEVQKKLTDDNLKSELSYEREGYENFLQEFSDFLKEQNYRAGDLPALKKTGVAGFFVVSAIASADDPAAAALELARMWDGSAR